MPGYVKIHRDIVTKDIYLQDPLYARVFERLIMEANHACKRIPYKGGTKLIKRGERLTSIRQIAEWVGWYQRGIFKSPNPKTISKILDWMIEKGLIEIINRGNSQETHYNIVNYCIYQSADDYESNSKVTVRGAVSKQSVDTNNNVNNVNNEKNDKKTIGDISAPQFKLPTIEDIKAYCLERQNNVDAEKWHNFYSSKGWMIGKNKMKDWKAAVRTWEKERKLSRPSSNPFLDALKEMQNEQI